MSDRHLENGKKKRNKAFEFILDNWPEISEVIFIILIIGGSSALFLYDKTNIPELKWLGIILLLPFLILILALVTGFLVCFIINCFYCIIPNQKSKDFFPSDDFELPWYWAVFWLIIIFITLSKTIPILLYNTGGF